MCLGIISTFIELLARFLVSSHRIMILGGCDINRSHIHPLDVLHGMRIARLGAGFIYSFLRGFIIVLRYVIIFRQLVFMLNKFFVVIVIRSILVGLSFSL